MWLNELIKELEGAISVYESNRRDERLSDFEMGQAYGEYCQNVIILERLKNI